MARIAVPLRLINLNDDGFHILVEIKIFGILQWAVIDTGASRSVFDKRFIEKHSQAPISVEESAATTLFSTSAAIQTVIPKIRIGRLTIKKYPAVGLDLEAVNAAYSTLGHPHIIGILGSDLFHLYRATIKYKKLKILFSTKVRRADKAG